MNDRLTAEQVTQLLRQINPARVAVLDGLSHLEAYDVRAHLIRCFGFAGWSGDVLSMELLYEEPTQTRGGKAAFKVAYRCTYRLVVAGASYTEVAVGESVMPDFKRGDCHDMAAKTAESQALKRCAVNLGDQFGLSLYRKGSTQALVQRTLVMPGETVSAQAAPVDHEIAPVVPEATETPAPAPESSLVSPREEQVERGQDPSGEGDGGQDQLETVEEMVSALRQRVLDAMQERNRNTALQLLTRISMEAGQRKLLNEQTMSPAGEPMTLNLLVDTAIKLATRNPK